MAESKARKSEIRENPLIAELLAKGVENSRVMRGFIGPSRDERYITLYQSLDKLGDTVEIPRDDVLHVIDAPRSTLGASILWISTSSNVSVRRTKQTEVSDAGRGQEVTKGRLRMKLKPAWGGGVCTSVCEPCISWCDCNICQTLPE